MNSGDLRYITVKSYKNESMLIITTVSDNPDIKKVMEFSLQNGFKSVYWLKNDTKHDSFEGEIVTFVGEETLTIPITVDNQTFNFLVGPFTFFQNNIYCFEVLLNYINKFISTLDSKTKILYDLYCGVGLLGIIFAKSFKEVKGIEIVQQSIELAVQNKNINKVENINFEIKDIKEMNFLPDNKSVVIVDPPRNGLEVKGVENILQIPNQILLKVSTFDTKKRGRGKF